MKKNLEWWNKLLLAYNSLSFFDIKKRRTQTFYINVYLYDLDRFYFEGYQSQKQAYINQLQAYCIIIWGKPFL